MTVFLSMSPRLERASEWQPAVDVYRTKWGWILKIELAGVRLGDVEVGIARRSVTISGLRRDYMVEDGCSYYSMEIRYSRFKRTIELPTDLDGSQFHLDYRDGILIVRIQLKEDNHE